MYCQPKTDIEAREAHTPQTPDPMMPHPPVELQMELFTQRLATSAGKEKQGKVFEGEGGRS